jgi:hypothetical protein
VRLNGAFKMRNGVLVVGMHTGAGNEIPVANVPPWGNSTFAGESAVLAYFRANELVNPDDDPTDLTTSLSEATRPDLTMAVYPNPAHDRVQVVLPANGDGVIALLDLRGRVLHSTRVVGSTVAIDLSGYAVGTYLVQWLARDGRIARALVVRH